MDCQLFEGFVVRSCGEVIEGRTSSYSLVPWSNVVLKFLKKLKICPKASNIVYFAVLF